ncbi:unnamed protein product [Anisakis simplex]|uniref:Kinase D-interacting substrate of 220 kDa-like SAM domain-containing protein n=1 Tax=Anisakis simplex TaxID=6269 RepID=A0A0M3J9I9_ANISI|nr:unnamed protein product [Anisakis simplex]
MRIEDIVKLVKRLEIASDRVEIIINRIRSANLNGLVLYACDLGEVQQTLKLSLGDWTLLKLLIETLRQWNCSTVSNQQHTYNPALIAPLPTMPLSTSLASIQECKRKLTAQVS